MTFLTYNAEQCRNKAFEKQTSRINETIMSAMERGHFSCICELPDSAGEIMLEHIKELLEKYGFRVKILAQPRNDFWIQRYCYKYKIIW